MKQRHADIGGSLEFLQGLPAVRTFREVRLQIPLFFVVQFARGRNGAQLKEFLMWSYFRPPVSFLTVLLIFHAVELLAHYSQTFASATYLIPGNSGAAHSPRASPFF